jgi:hypothetical protein
MTNEDSQEMLRLARLTKAAERHNQLAMERGSRVWAQRAANLTMAAHARGDRIVQRNIQSFRSC